MLSLHLERVADISFEKPEIDLGSDEEFDGSSSSVLKFRGDSHKELFGKIEFKDVWYKYGEADPWILKGVSFIIQAGEMVVITGPSGGGKTTLLKLILGLDVPQRGQILIDDIPLSNSDIRRYRQAFGTVMQNDALMSGTIADNISFYDQNVDMDCVVTSAKQASIDAEIDALPMKYDTLIGHMGSSLSGGQQQRLLLARALYRQPSFLVMDEGTANLDAANEQIILDNIKVLNATRITVGHRKAVIRSANRLFHMGRGRIEEIGTGMSSPSQIELTGTIDSCV